jgi:1-aminocyclopropane-1-carboxylate deaminase/D-cysteine desulfhydrase-like pyridoxal-dependent ACC family enzyme
VHPWISVQTQSFRRYWRGSRAWRWHICRRRSNGCLGAELGIDLWVKRDDCTGIGFGGNKVRQLEYYFGAAQVVAADTVLITGAIQSNFMRTAAAMARRLGLESIFRWRSACRTSPRSTALTAMSCSTSYSA